MISTTEADWSREKPGKFWDPDRKLLGTIRRYHQYRQKKGIIAWGLTRVCVLQHQFWTVISGADIPINWQPGGGLLIPHPNGIVIHPRTTIGVNCLIHQQVTIGVKRGSDRPPVIGGHVDIGAGAKIIGDIHIGDDALIGANAVVVKDVKAGDIAAGVPAKVIGSTYKEPGSHD